jgi:hypothetical protein
MFGLLVGLVRMVLDFSYREPLCMEIDDRPFIVKKVQISTKISFVLFFYFYRNFFLLSRPVLEDILTFDVQQVFALAFIFLKIDYAIRLHLQ